MTTNIVRLRDNGAQAVAEHAKEAAETGHDLVLITIDADSVVTIYGSDMDGLRAVGAVAVANQVFASGG